MVTCHFLLEILLYLIKVVHKNLKILFCIKKVCAFVDTHTTNLEQLRLFKVHIYNNISLNICQNVLMVLLTLRLYNAKLNIVKQ